LDENDVYQIGKSHAQPNRDVNKSIEIDISYIEPGYKRERYQSAATCDLTVATTTDTLKSKNQLVPCLNRWQIQIIKPQGFKIDYIRADNAGKSTNHTHDAFLTEIKAGPQHTSRYNKRGTEVAERANGTLATAKKAGNFPSRAITTF